MASMKLRRSMEYMETYDILAQAAWNDLTVGDQINILL